MPFSCTLSLSLSLCFSHYMPLSLFVEKCSQRQMQSALHSPTNWSRCRRSVVLARSRPLLVAGGCDAGSARSVVREHDEQVTSKRRAPRFASIWLLQFLQFLPSSPSPVTARCSLLLSRLILLGVYCAELWNAAIVNRLHCGPARFISFFPCTFLSYRCVYVCM